MSKSFLSSFAVTILLVSGLCSCSKDKTVTESANDNFNVDPPVLHARYREAGASFKLNTQDVALDAKMPDAVYPTSVIEMPSLKNQNFEAQPVTIDITSSCQTKDTATSQETFTTHLSNVQSFQMMNILLPSFLVKVSEVQASAVCSLEFNFGDSLGSTVTFRYKDVPIAPLMRSDLADFNVYSKNLDGAEYDHSLPVVAENQDRSKMYPLITQTRLGYMPKPQDRLLLVCESYASQIFARDAGEISLAQFAGAPLVWNKNLSGIDPRSSPLAEDCRIMHETNDMTKTMQFSRQFHLVQKTPDLRITMTMNNHIFSPSGLKSNFNNDHDQELVHLQVYNPTNERIKIQLPNLLIDFIGRIANLPNKRFNQNIEPTVQGGLTENTFLSTGKLSSIPAESEINVSYVLHYNGTCTIGPGGIIATPQFEQALFQTLRKFIIIQFTDSEINPANFYKTYEDIEIGLPPPMTVTEIGQNVMCR